MVWTGIFLLHADRLKWQVYRAAAHCCLWPHCLWCHTDATARTVTLKWSNVEQSQVKTSKVKKKRKQKTKTVTHKSQLFLYMFIHTYTHFQRLAGTPNIQLISGSIWKLIMSQLLTYFPLIQQYWIYSQQELIKNCMCTHQSRTSAPSAALASAQACTHSNARFPCFDSWTKPNTSSSKVFFHQLQRTWMRPYVLSQLFRSTAKIRPMP